MLWRGAFCRRYTVVSPCLEGLLGTNLRHDQGPQAANHTPLFLTLMLVARGAVGLQTGRVGHLREVSHGIWKSKGPDVPSAHDSASLSRSYHRSNLDR